MNGLQNEGAISYQLSAISYSRRAAVSGGRILMHAAC
jgi:hypothetical protein